MPQECTALLMRMLTTAPSPTQRMETWELWPPPSCSPALSLCCLFVWFRVLGMPTSKVRQITAVIYPGNMILILFWQCEDCFNLNRYFHHRPFMYVVMIKLEQYAQNSRCFKSSGTSMQKSLRILGLLNLIQHTWSKPRYLIMIQA